MIKAEVVEFEKYLELDQTRNYYEGDIVKINGVPHQYFRNPYLGNELTWVPVGVAPIGYVEVKP